jgi:chromatin assembly factor 1 subunit B
MKANPLIINWHDQNAPIYSAHFEPGGRGRLATAGGDNNVRLWQVDTDGPERKVDYLATLAKHNQAVNVVRWAPKGLWPLSEPYFHRATLLLTRLPHVQARF